MPKPRSPVYGDPSVGQVTEVKDISADPSKAFLLAANAKIGAELHDLATQLFDHSHPVDELQSTESGGSALSIECLPEYEVNEMINSIIVCAPPAAAVTLQLGYRYMSLVMPATGVIYLGGPLGLRLDRNDRRILTSGTAGPLLLELTGYADVRG
jgi:hypothetical protein